MGARLDHTIIYSRDRRASATFVSDILGLPAPAPAGPFLALRMENNVTLDFFTADGEISPQHYAFLVADTTFDQILGRLQQRALPYWADPFHHRQGEISANDAGRGLYFEDPSGHNLEIITRPSWISE